jgi:hypothetical protein
MKRAILEHLTDPGDSSFIIKKAVVPHFGSVWHYHPLTEIILIIEGRGTGFIGDTICPFYPGTLSIIGRGMPHVWLNGKEYYEGNPDMVARNTVIWFKDDFLGEAFKLIPEMKRVNELLHSAARGMVFHGRTQKILERKILSIEDLDELQKLICLLEVLDIMSRSDEYKFLFHRKFKGYYRTTPVKLIKRHIEHANKMSVEFFITIGIRTIFLY